MNEAEKILASLGKVEDQLKEHAARATSDGQVLAKHKQDVDQLLTTQGELKAELQAMAQTIDKVSKQTQQPAAAQTPGQVFTSGDGFERFAAQASGGGRYSYTQKVKAAITSAPGSAGVNIQPDRIGLLPTVTQRLFLRDLLTWGRTTSNSLEYVRESGFTNSANVVSENPANPKPESDLEFELESAPVATIAHWVRASKQVLADVPMLQSYIDGRLMYGLKLKEEQQLLKGSGVGLNLNGLYTQATQFANPGVVVQNETAIDRIRMAMLQVTLAEYDADGIVLSPVDWTSIELTKTADNAYLFASPTSIAQPMLWGRRVVATQAMDPDDFLVGAFAQGAQGWDREDANVTVSTDDRDNFVKNMVTILCEERVGLTVYRPEAFVRGALTGS